ncbi:MAG TPA: ABC transporter permease [Ohtaekwangia sp.]|nr:ABC transporter permease [Ohtaekwangia sp.]
MIQNLFTVTFRNLKKYRFYTFINVFGLTIGITACLVIFLFIRFELSFDEYNTNADRIVRIDWEVRLGETHTYNAAVTPPMAEAFVREFPEVDAAARLRFSGSGQFKVTTENQVETSVVYADNDLFKIFSFEFIAGDPTNALLEPNSMVISESCAARFFPDENPLGKTLIKDNETLYKVTGVIEDMPENAHFRFNMFLSMEGLAESKNENWIGGPFNTYLLLRPDADPKELESKLPIIVDKYVMPHATAVLGNNFVEQFKRQGNSLTLHVMPLTDIHLHSHLSNELGNNGDIKYIYLLGGVAMFILILAVVNFTNLATARSIKRAREVGIRKAMGSSRAYLGLQFVTESVMLSLLAFMIALAATEITLPYFNTLTGSTLGVPFGDIKVMASLFGVAILTGVLAGLYPGFVLSSYKPVNVLKGKLPIGESGTFLRSGLVVFQFTVSIFLTIATLAIITQTRFMQNKELGFSPEQIIRLKDVSNAGQGLYTFRDEMLKHPVIKSATISSYFPGPGSARKTPLIWRYGMEPAPSNSVNIEQWAVDYDYAATLGLEFIAGRDFAREFPSDSTAVIINASAARRLGISADPIGERLNVFHENPDGSQDRSRIATYTVVGVVKDFNFESLRDNVQPLGLFFGKSTGSIAFRYETAHTPDVIDALRSTWQKVVPGEPFIYAFVDEDFQRLYTTEQKLSRIFTLFSGLAIVIACLGLFALTSFTAEQRTKEIGIRKVLGASVQQIVVLLSLSFGRLILISFLVAAPLAAFGIRWYLEQYAYKADITVWLYLEAGFFASLLAAITLGYQSIKAARNNPVESLKCE